MATDTMDPQDPLMVELLRALPKVIQYLRGRQFIGFLFKIPFKYGHQARIRYFIGYW